MCVCMSVCVCLNVRGRDKREGVCAEEKTVVMQSSRGSNQEGKNWTAEEKFSPCFTPCYLSQLVIS